MCSRLLVLAWLGLSLSALCSRVSAHVFVAPVDQAQWQVESSRLKCALWQDIPSYGSAGFNHRAGETLKFWLQTRRKVVNLEQAQLQSVPPEWKADFSSRALGHAQLHAGHKPLELAEPRSSRVLAELQLGMFAKVQHGGWYPGHRVNVMVSSVNFSSAYSDYLDCIAGLFPANFEQLERTTLLFGSGQWSIHSDYRARLKLIAEYLEVDPDVKKIVIDGHTDSIGRMGYNWDLSRSRAEAVAALLKQMGVAETNLRIRYHGEQYPVDDNKTVKNRTKNRRVTLRLEKS